MFAVYRNPYSGRDTRSHISRDACMGPTDTVVSVLYALSSAVVTIKAIEHTLVAQTCMFRYLDKPGHIIDAVVPACCASAACSVLLPRVLSPAGLISAARSSNMAAFAQAQHGRITASSSRAARPARCATYDSVRLTEVGSSGM